MSICLMPHGSDGYCLAQTIKRLLFIMLYRMIGMKKNAYAMVSRTSLLLC